MKTVVIVPARGGSKGVKRKNIRDLCGKPLINYTLEAAKRDLPEADLFVTTDDLEIADVCRNIGADVLMRTEELSNDKALMPPVVLNALEQLEEEGKNYDLVILLQPTCPFRPKGLLTNVVASMEEEEVNSLITVSDVGDHHPARMYKIESDKLIPECEEYETLNRQDLPKVYQRNGMVYAVKVPFFKKEKTFFDRESIPLIVESLYAVNIDEIWDFYLAESMIKNNAIPNF